MSSHRGKTSLLWVIGGLLLVALVGCQRARPSGVAGAVTFNGEPILAGNIRFDPLEETHGSGASTRIVDGRYTIERGNGLFAGRYLVAISATRNTGRTIAGEGLAGETNSIDEVVQYIPEKYNARSKLRSELTAGENAKDFTLNDAL